jgi:hypothetical protein
VLHAPPLEVIANVHSFVFLSQSIEVVSIEIIELIDALDLRCVKIQQDNHPTILARKIGNRRFVCPLQRQIVDIAH